MGKIEYIRFDVNSSVPFLGYSVSIMAFKFESNDLYSSKEVVNKYVSFNTRVRQLNIPERLFIDHYQIYNKKVLIIGSGAGRVPTNLLLFGNHVTTVESSLKLYEFATETYPNSKFKNLHQYLGNGNDLDFLKEKFDVVFFPMNGLDLAQTLDERVSILMQMSKKLRPNGILAYSSHNLTAYGLSYKLNQKRNILKLFKTFEFSHEKTTGGGATF